jgi:hypothetical protein
MNPVVEKDIVVNVWPITRDWVSCQPVISLIILNGLMIGRLPDLLPFKKGSFERLGKRVIGGIGSWVIKFKKIGG